ncbi:uncharacterized protein KD926_000826 [Aspergillus affinis]|uniref:uncharacterized protein n=1 Tax=Aspergillus affinis TaxID=1070780 RepID=UPI0022FF10AC|nr:uncharacterized protein KD926_000826 [Aspergillus affinis]KAI9037109.1 hypothetical protein KD926_000826 [Aspergillus affinis]
MPSNETSHQYSFHPPSKSNSLSNEPQLTTHRLVYNTSDASTLDRFRIRELCEGWPLHRDACEWTDLRAIFSPHAFINISWQQNYRDAAIKTWAKGWEKGDFITHRVLGHAVEIKGHRAIDKMKVTISWRFKDDNGVEWDSDCDCRFVFFLERTICPGWQILCNHPIYEKDKCVPVDPGRLPTIDYEILDRQPRGYKYLAYGMQSLGYKVKQNLPQLFGEERDALYREIADWLNGEEIDFSKDEW